MPRLDLTFWISGCEDSKSVHFIPESKTLCDHSAFDSSWIKAACESDKSAHLGSSVWGLL